MVVDSFRSATVSLEPYVDSIVAGKFLGLHPVTVMRRTYIGALPGDYRGALGPELRPISTAGLTHARANEGDRHDAE
jgi:hypothetical protein